MVNLFLQKSQIGAIQSGFFMIQLAALQSIQIIFFRVFQRVPKGYFP